MNDQRKKRNRVYLPSNDTTQKTSLLQLGHKTLPLALVNLLRPRRPLLLGQLGLAYIVLRN